MARNGSGVHSLPGGYEAVTGQTITAAQHNSPLEDLSAEITASLPRAGTAAMTGNLPMGSNKITGLGTPTVGTDAVTKTYADAVVPADADYGDVTVASGVWTIDNDAITTAKILNANVTKAKIENLADYKVLGNVSGGAAAPAEVAILDEDTMSSDSATSLVTQQSVKAYTDTQVAWKFVEEITGTGTSLASTADLSSYDLLRVTIIGVPDVADTLTFEVATSGPTWLAGSSYYYESNYDEHPGSSGSDTVSTASEINLTDSASSILANGFGVRATLDIAQFAATEKTGVLWTAVWQHDTTVFARTSSPSVGFINTTTALTNLRFRWAGGNDFTAASGVLIEGRSFA